MFIKQSWYNFIDRESEAIIYTYIANEISSLEYCSIIRSQNYPSRANR